MVRAEPRRSVGRAASWACAGRIGAMRPHGARSVAANAAVRSEALSAYRKLLHAAHRASHECPLYNKSGLPVYLSERFFDVAERNRQFHVGRQLIRQQIAAVEYYASAITQAPGNPALTSMLQALAAGVGGVMYQRAIEKGFVDFLKHEEEKSKRMEADEEASSERQNRLLQYALQPYAERLSNLCRVAESAGAVATGGAVGSDFGGAVGAFSSQEAIDAIVGTRHNVQAHFLCHGKDHVILEVDANLNKQTIFVSCEDYDWTSEVENVEVAECESVRGTVFHAEYLSIAERLLDAVTSETPLHPYRSTVIVGHGVGGAVGLCMSLILNSRGFEVKNVVSFGAPKAIESTLDRYVTAVNPIRVVMAGDPLIDLPVSGSEGALFVHVGEILLMDWSRRVKHETPSNRDRVAEPSGESESEAAGQAPTASFAANNLTADTLGDLMMDDSCAWSAEEPQTDVAHGKSERERLPSRAREEGFFYTEDVEDEMHNQVDRAFLGIDDEGTSGSTGAACDTRHSPRIAATRYRAGFTAAHYMRCFADSEADLTYAEGDEVWDDGSAADAQRRRQMMPHTRVPEKWKRDREMPL